MLCGVTATLGSNPSATATAARPQWGRAVLLCLDGVRARVLGPGCLVCLARPGCLVCPWAAARPRAVRAASFARRVASKPGQAPPPPTGTAAWPSGTLHTGGACVAVTSTARPYRMGTAAWVSGLSTQWRPVADVDWCVGSKPARALRALRYPPHGGACVAVRGWARRLEAWPGPAPPTGTAAHGFHSLAQQVLRCPPYWSCKPPSGGGEITVRGGVMPKVQTTSAKNAENGLLWAKWSAFWAHRYLS